MVPSASTAALRTILEEQLTKTAGELRPVLEAHVAARTAETRERARAEVADALNQAVRRLRQASGFAEVAATLADVAGSYCAGAALLRVCEDRVKGERIRGVDADAAERFQTLDLPLAGSAALTGAVDTQDQVVAMSTAAEVSPALAEIAGHGGEARVSIFPLAAHGRVEALLYCWGEVAGAPLELLAQVAGLCLPAPEPAAAPAAPPAELVAIAAAPAPLPEPAAEPASAGSHEWSELSPEEQQAHLRAQRFARVQVAEMRLFHAEAVLAGRIHRDLYGALRDTIDAARDRYRRSFIATCPGMIDYLHQELVRTLANDNPKLLGAEYPGALV